MNRSSVQKPASPFLSGRWVELPLPSWSYNTMGMEWVLTRSARERR